MALPTLNDDQRLYLQTIFDYFHEYSKWPIYRYIDRKLRRVLAVCRREQSRGLASRSSGARPSQ